MPLDWGAVHWDALAMVDTGGVLLPSFMVLDFAGADSQPGLTIEADLVDGRYKVTEVRLEAKPGARGVTAEDLRAVRLESWVRQVANLLAVEVEDNPASAGQVAAWSGDLSASGRRAAEASTPKRGRQPLGADHYRRVARVYVDGGGRVQAVADALDATFTTASRWVRKARELGLLDPKEANR